MLTYKEAALKLFLEEAVVQHQGLTISDGWHLQPAS
jgi:hypothetical protein